MASAHKHKKVVPPARPSRPSARLIALVIPTKKNRGRGIDSHSGIGMRSSRVSAINLADGLDGLAGGTTFLCLCALAILAYSSGQLSCTALALAFGGAILGFLRYNTYPASVFMGDAGSQLLGFAVG